MALPQTEQNCDGYSIREYSEKSLLGSAGYDELPIELRLQKPRGADVFLKTRSWADISDHERRMIFQYLVQTDKLALVREQRLAYENLKQ